MNKDPRSYGIIQLLLSAGFCNAQSIMYSPVAASSPDLTLEFGYTYALLFDQSGLSFNFTSGSTSWPSQLCSFTHNYTTDLECWSITDFDLDTAHVILDMGEALTWDRMAFFNEESAGFGLDPIVVEYGLEADGPWQTLCSWSLTDNPINIPEYPPDLLLFPFDVTARYFRIRGSTTDNLQRFAIAEIILGTASPSPAAGACLRNCLPLAVTEDRHAMDGCFANVDPARERVMITATDITDLRCFDHTGRSLSILGSEREIDISHLGEGAYILVALWKGRTATLRFVKNR